jgi:hypothetical protein
MPVTKAYGKFVRMTPCNLNTSTKRNKVVRFKLRPFFPTGYGLWCPWFRKFSRTEFRCGSFAKDKNLSPLPKIKARFLTSDKT